MLFVSFTPDGDWFVFDADGKTVQRNFRTRKFAEMRAYAMMFLVTP